MIVMDGGKRISGENSVSEQTFALLQGNSTSYGQNWKRYSLFTILYSFFIIIPLEVIAL